MPLDAQLFLDVGQFTLGGLKLGFDCTDLWTQSFGIIEKKNRETIKTWHKAKNKSYDYRCTEILCGLYHFLDCVGSQPS